MGLSIEEQRIEMRAQDLLSMTIVEGRRSDRLTLAKAIIKLQDRQSALESALGLTYVGGKFEDPALAGVKVESLQDMINTPAHFAGKEGAGTATGEQVAKLNAAPDDAEITELYTQVRAASQENERLKAVNQEMVSRYESQLTALVAQLEETRAVNVKQAIDELGKMTEEFFATLPKWKPEHVQPGVFFRLADSNWAVLARGHFYTHLRREAGPDHIEEMRLPTKYVLMMMHDAGDRVGGFAKPEGT